MAKELSIQFETVGEKKGDKLPPLTVKLFRPDNGNYTPTVDFEPPLDDKVLKEIAWYLEVYSDWPTGPDFERAGEIEEQMRGWGEQLRKSVIQGEDAARLWQQFVDASEKKMLTIDATDPRVLRLPWELLADHGGHLFARRISIRRRLQRPITIEPGRFELPVRVLVVVARPDDAGFISPRAITEPLLNALQPLDNQVNVEFLYPPTLAALSARLDNRRLPQVHVLHFDGHGVYDLRQGLGYLLFEDEEHKSNRVDAEQLGTLLYDCRVPLAVLNACQSAKQEEANPFASVAARLVESGVSSVLAMNYSVLVVAARKFVQAFYGSLANGRSVGTAVDKGRRALLADEKRHSYHTRNDAGELVEQTVRLRDWFLPALYQQAADPIIFSGDGISAPVTSSEKKPHPAQLPAEPRHGFHGRARELLALERAFARAPVVVVHGYGGQGKTALAAEAGRWFTRTGRFPGGAAFISFEHGGSLMQLCSWVGQMVSEDADFMANADDPVAEIAALLKAKPALLILDNFESVVGQDPVIPAEELAPILDTVWAWANAGGDDPAGPRVLVTTRDTHLGDPRFAPSRHCRHIPLGGLATGDALQLAAAVLDDVGIGRERAPREELIQLMERLGGHPLSLNLVLPHLREYTIAELTDQFETLLPGFVQGQARERNESLAVSLEFSLRRLGPETRAQLPALGIFQGGAFEDDLLAITEMDAELWAAARAELAGAALLTVETIPGVGPPFLRFHPTLAPYLAGELADANRAVLETRYWPRYYALANTLYHADAQTPHQARAIALRELPNLRRGLALALAAGSVAAAVDFATYIARFLMISGRQRERAQMLARVQAAVSAGQAGAGAGDGPLAKAEFLLASQQGEVWMQSGRAAEAETLFRNLLARMEAGMAYSGIEAEYDRAATQMRLARCLRAQGRPGQAIPLLKTAQKTFTRLGAEDKDVRQMAGRVATDLGDCLAETGKYEDARKAYEEGLIISNELKDYRSVGVKLGQLGTLAMRQGDLAEAARRYQEALATFQQLGEPAAEATIWHQLGMVAEEGRQWAEAERCYRESLRLEEAQNNLPGVAQTCNQLGMVAEGAGRLADAERWYLRAIEVNTRIGNQLELSRNNNNLAGLYLAQNRLAEAKQYALRAAAIKETLDLSAKPWTTYTILAQIAEREGDADAATRYRRQSQETFAQFPGAPNQIQQFMPIIQAVIGAANGDPNAQTFLDNTYPQMRAGSEEWARTADTLQRIVNGERNYESLTENLDFIRAYLTRTILANMQATPEATGRETEATGAGLDVAALVAALPPAVRTALEQQDADALRAALAALPEAEAQEIVALLFQAASLADGGPGDDRPVCAI